MLQKSKQEQSSLVDIITGEQLPVVVEQARHSHISEPHSYVWLEREYGQASTMDIHYYCAQCGAVRVAARHGKPASFFVQGIANMVKYAAIRKSKITECQARLMARAVVSDPELSDSYSTQIDMQIERYISLVRSFRPEFEEEEIVKSLFRKERKAAAH